MSQGPTSVSQKKKGQKSGSVKARTFEFHTEMKILEQDSLLANDLLEKARTRRRPEGVPQRGAASRSDEPFTTLLAAAKRVRLASWQLPMGQQPPQVQDCIALTEEAANAHARWDPRVQPAALSFL